MKFLQKLKSFSIIAIASALTIFATGYVFANSYEVVTLRDLPTIPSVSVFEMQKVYEIQKQSIDIEGYRWDSIMISSAGNKLPLVKAWSSNGKMLQQASKGHYIFLATDPVHTVGDSVIYLTKSWRTIYNPDSIKVGDLIKVENEKNIYTYRATDVSKKHIDEPNVFGDDQRINLLLIIYDGESNYANYVNSIQISDEQKL